MADEEKATHEYSSDEEKTTHPFSYEELMSHLKPSDRHIVDQEKGSRQEIWDLAAQFVDVEKESFWVLHDVFEKLSINKLYRKVNNAFVQATRFTSTKDKVHGQMEGRDRPIGSTDKRRRRTSGDDEKGQKSKRERRDTQQTPQDERPQRCTDLSACPVSPNPAALTPGTTLLEPTALTGAEVDFFGRNPFRKFSGKTNYPFC